MEDQNTLFNNLSKDTSLNGIQDYVRKVLSIRGFDEETERDIMLLMIEEVGELAKSIRKQTGLKIDKSKLGSYSSVSEEIADVFIYLVDLANALNINILEAFKNKEEKNIRRIWEKSN